jgi:translation initiation factor IF-2
MTKTKKEKPEKTEKAAAKKKSVKVTRPKIEARAVKTTHKPVKAKASLKPAIKESIAKSLKVPVVKAPGLKGKAKTTPSVVAVGGVKAPVAPAVTQPVEVVLPEKALPAAAVVKPSAVPAKVAVPVEQKPLPPVEPKPRVEIKPSLQPQVAREITPAAPVAEVAAVEARAVEITLPISVKDLAVKLQQKPSVLIKMLMDMKVMAGINQTLDEPLVEVICEKFSCRITKTPDAEEIALSVHSKPDAPGLLKPRAPIVTFMGHVDHGKTSLLDAIRKTKVAEREHGGITQHIGAYRVVLPHGEITFLDTPGHEAFTAMRARGASVTDIVVLVVAADDGVMPQTREAIDHARAAGVSIVVAINKIDKAQADVDIVKKQLGELNLLAEDWGGKTITVGVSAKTGEGIDQLLEMILLEAHMLELKGNPDKLAKGTVLEAKMSPGRGIVVTLLVHNGSLRLNDNIVVGNFFGKIRAMFNHLGMAVTVASCGVPVEVMGIAGVPEAGEQFYAFEDEKTAKDIALRRREKEKQQQMKAVVRISLEDLHAQIKAGKIKELKVIVKADVQGSLGAIRDVITKLAVEEINIDIIHEAVGNINSSDAVLAVASNALILGFHISIDDLAKEVIAREGIDVRTYNIIYELANDLKAALEGMLEPKLKRVFLGRVEVRKVFKLSRSGTIAGCFVSKGKINRNASVNLVRNDEVVFDGKISSLKRFKDDVREVAEGFECGISLGGFDNLMEGDVIEAFEIEKIARKL